MTALPDLARRSRYRLDAARRIAEHLRHNEEHYRLAMRAVFLLEDCHESLVRAQRAFEQPPDSVGGIDTTD